MSKTIINSINKKSVLLYIIFYVYNCIHELM